MDKMVCHSKVNQTKSKLNFQHKYIQIDIVGRWCIESNEILNHNSMWINVLDKMIYSNNIV